MCIVLDFRYPLEAKRCALFQPSSKWLLRLFFFRLVSSVFGRGASANRQSISRNRSQNLTVQYSASRDRVRPGGSSEYEDDFTLINRRTMIGLIFGISRLAVSFDAGAAGLPPEQMPRLCDDACKEKLENVPMITTESGLQYKDIKVGIGPSPPVGFQVIKGLDEGILTMKIGGKRRLYIPGSVLNWTKSKVIYLSILLSWSSPTSLLTGA
ncbi:uncharacterized protein LOC122656846 isoform X7 [Telopea speciosissima]|uniref:uncharacterized protein LOC122656846 isoform X7 n=1 Tax=Telopea speciosissima TaxID=54955 RepID=UPI001CC5E5D3|nr:uncharacterized protein LOC122656846 isoform X7 [Telopea speciosissima]